MLVTIPRISPRAAVAGGVGGAEAVGVGVGVAAGAGAAGVGVAVGVKLGVGVAVGEAVAVEAAVAVELDVSYTDERRQCILATKKVILANTNIATHTRNLVDVGKPAIFHMGVFPPDPNMRICVCVYVCDVG